MDFRGLGTVLQFYALVIFLAGMGVATLLWWIL